MHKGHSNTVITKSFLVSRTVYLNAIALALALANHYGVTPSAVPVMDPQVVAMVIAALNIGLRLITKTPVTLTLPTAQA